MIIGVDCHVLAGKFQGSRTYLLNLYQAILALHPKHEFVFLGHWAGQKPFGDDPVYADYLSHSRWKRLTYQTAPLAKHLRLDLLHSNYISPLLLPCPSLLTVHDVIYQTHPQYFKATEVIRNKLFIKHSIRTAAQIHTVSEYSRRALIEIYKLPDESVSVVPNGVDLTRFNPRDRNLASAKVNDKFKIQNYILTVGRLEPRKNHIGLLYAYALLKKNKIDVGPLVIVGQKDFRFHELFSVIHKLKLQDNVKILESVTDDLLPDIYRAARLFVYPSFAEGFGIPPLEAMACGTPIVSSNTSAMPEVVGNAGLLINPNSPEEIASSMFTILSSQSLADDLAIKGRNQAEKWSWSNAAQRYLSSLAVLE